MFRVLPLFIGFMMLFLRCTPVVQNEEEENDKSVVCFVYHRFGDDRYPSTNIETSQFEAHLSFLKKNGYQVLGLADAIDYLQSGAKAQKTAVITIDDGYSSFYENGWPLLKEYEMPATLFINTETVGASGYIDWQELKKLESAGIEIGNHTHTHQYFLNLPENKRHQVFKEELELSQKIIKEKLGLTPKTFAYPFGELDLKMKGLVEEAGFNAAVAQNSGVISSTSDLYRLPRFPMSTTYSDLEKFKSKARMQPLIVKKEPIGFLIPDGETRPDLTLTVKTSGVIMDQMQCFIQGSSCELNIDENRITIKSKDDISGRRRTLYTITVPDQNGQWHWFSHLWINPEVK